MDYLSPSIHSKVGAAEMIDVFETQMYSILEGANSIEKGEIMKATKIRTQITDLMRELTTYKAGLRKENIDQKEHLINRLEDLQENIADFEHNFSTKFQFHKGLGEFANDRFKSKQVEDAQQHHRKVDDMFEL